MTTKSRAVTRSGVGAAKSGFTLLEIMIAVTIVALFSTAVAVGLPKLWDTALRKRAVTDLATISSALELYHLACRDYPSTDPGLGALIEKPSGCETWAGPYLKGKKEFKDPWRRPYAYELLPGEAEGYKLSSFGKDGVSGSPDDITSDDIE
ncbi:MAG: type II secretion system major pseudopilin GspG [Nitrospirae bacterium]|nr:type II secretion system major pseudopilin GspG [Nitrospirota bacterium]